MDGEDSRLWRSPNQVVGRVPSALDVEGLVCAFDEVFEIVERLELCQSNGQRRVMRVGQVAVDEQKSFGSVRDGHIRQPADELIAAVSNDQVVRAKVSPDRVRRAAQEPVTSSMASRVVDRLEVVNVHEGQRQRLLCSFRPRYLTLQLENSCVSSVGVREAVDEVGRTLSRREHAVGRCRLAVVRRSRAVARPFPTIAKRGRTVTPGGHVDVAGQLAGFRTAIPSIGSCVCNVGGLVARVGFPVPILSGAVAVIARLIRTRLLLIVGAARIHAARLRHLSVSAGACRCR